MANKLTLKAIGVVRNKIAQPPQPDEGKVISDIVVNSSLTEALDGLEAFSHLVVLSTGCIRLPLVECRLRFTLWVNRSSPWWGSLSPGRPGDPIR